ncbi:hypothetical protein GALL_488150 [mine drainage metagenome]|uniref:Uncharacterized protein n=1 Tax=mine drainage metagenome TaxID=410659 RepID=A0A1J5PP80_9ZZZZ
MAANRAGSGRTLNARLSPPSMLTSATPGTVRSAGRSTHCSTWRFSASDAPPSSVNMYKSDSGVVTGASPPCTAVGSSPRTLASASATCWRAQ